VYQKGKKELFSSEVAIAEKEKRNTASPRRFLWHLQNSGSVAPLSYLYRTGKEQKKSFATKMNENS
jgi:hypothetical protein